MRKRWGGYEEKKIWRWGGVEESHSQRKEAALKSPASSADTSASLFRWQQVNSLWLAGFCLFIFFGLFSGSSCHQHQWCSVEGTNEVLVGFNPPLSSNPVLGHAHLMAVCNVCIQNTFYCSSVKVDNNLTRESGLFLTRIEMFYDHVRFFVMLFTEFTFSTSAPLM